MRVRCLYCLDSAVKRRWRLKGNQMKHASKKQLGLGALAGSLLAVSAAAPLSAGISGYGESGSEATYSITIENTSTGQWLTPPNWAAHDRSVRVFHSGARASVGVQAVAENGEVPVLAAELAAAIDDTGAGVSGVGAMAPIPPGGSATFMVTTDERNLSVVSMIVCTNDGFTGVDSMRLPQQMGATRTHGLKSYDAGTEVNTELRADIVPAPFCGAGGGSGMSNPMLAENGRISAHRGITGVGDMPSSFDWDNPVAQLTVSRVG